MSSSSDEITLRRILRLEEELDQLRHIVTAPTTILTALEMDRKEWRASFVEMGKQLGSVGARLDALEAALSKIATAVGVRAPSDPNAGGEPPPK